MSQYLFDQLSTLVSKDRIRSNTEEIHRLEGNESFSNYLASTDFAMKMMRESGFEDVRRIALPADGKTTYGDCVMPPAWDTTGRSFIRLEDESLSEQDRMLADSDLDPFNAGIWGAPTPEGGVDAEIVDYRTVGANAEALRDRLVLMDGYSQKQYRFIVESEAAGVIISDSKAGDEYPDNCRWCNGIGFAGWYHTAEDARIPIFSITPRKATFLRTRLAKGTLRAHAEAKTRIYDGQIYTVTGVLPVTQKEPFDADDEEITMLAHMYEPFLPDDAAGGAVICEICRCLKELIAQGRIPPLKKALRIVLSMERYGYHQYFLEDARRRRTLMVFSFDSCCHFTGEGQPQVSLRLSSVLHPSFLDRWAPRLMRKLLPETTFQVEKGNLSDDTFCSDADIGIPSFWLHSGNMRYHHNSGHAFMDADWDLACNVTRFMGTVIGLLATEGHEFFQDIYSSCLDGCKRDLEEILPKVQNEVRTGRMTAWEGDALCRFTIKRMAQELDSINAFCHGAAAIQPAVGTLEQEYMSLLGNELAPNATEPTADYLEETKSLIPARRTVGTLLSMVRVPLKERHGVSIPPLLHMLMDGKRSLFWCIKLYEFEMGCQFTQADYARFIDELRYLEKHGYVTLKNNRA